VSGTVHRRQGFSCASIAAKSAAALGLLLVLGLAPAPVAAAAATNAPALEFLGGKQSRTVEFGVCPSATQIEEGHGARASPGCDPSAAADPYLGGETTLLLRLDPPPAQPEERDPPLVVEFVPESKGARQLLCKQGEARVFVDGAPPTEGCSFAALPIQEGEVVPLGIGFKLPVGEALSSIEGSLEFTVDGVEQDQTVQVKAAMRELAKVDVNPGSVTLDSENPTAEVKLIGPGVVQLLRMGLLGETSVALRDDAGDATIATVEFKGAGEVEGSPNPDLARGVVRLSDDDPAPGDYKGELPVSHADAGGPSVEIELKSHRSPWAMVFLVFVGIVGIGLVTRLVTLATRRGLLLEALRQSVEAYRCIRESSKESRAWSLEDLLRLCESDDQSLTFGKRVRQWGEDLIGMSPKRYFGALLQGAPALEASIRQARSSKDLDEDADRTLDIIARIQRWLRAEPAARQLALVEESPHPAPLKHPKEEKQDPLEWRDSRVQLETLALLEAAKREPADADQADVLVASLLWQAKFHHDLAALWRVATDKEESKLAKKLFKLDKKMAEEDAKGGRGAEARDALDAELRSFRPKGWEPGEMLRPAEPVGSASTPGEIGITRVAWDASPNLFTGWATLDKPSYGQLTLRTATSSRSVYRRYGLLEILLLEARTLRPADVLLSLAILAGAAGVYGLSKYSHTWGSCEDMVAAFLAGATGAAAVKWGALPIFRSQRIRATKTA